MKDTNAASVKTSGKLRVHIQANIHAGEVEGKEATLVLLREFAQGQHADWLQSMVFLITPIFNADGNERFALTNRGMQNGPINGQGTRGNGQNLNINRDFMKLDTPEGRAFAKLWNDYDPYVGMDLHNNYVDMRNRFALLSEAYSYATVKDRILATNYFIEEAMNFAHQNVAKITKTVEDADREALSGTMLATRAQIRNGGMIEILMGEVETEVNPINGRNMHRRKDVLTPEMMADRLWFEPTAAGVALPAGAWAVPMNQPLARLAFYLLEPKSDDGAAAWNFLDDILGVEGIKAYPVLRKR